MGYACLHRAALACLNSDRAHQCLSWHDINQDQRDTQGEASSSARAATSIERAFEILSFASGDSCLQGDAGWMRVHGNEDIHRGVRAWDAHVRLRAQLWTDNRLTVNWSCGRLAAHDTRQE